jgi:hypothetical protein
MLFSPLMGWPAYKPLMASCLKASKLKGPFVLIESVSVGKVVFYLTPLTQFTVQPLL